MEREGGDYTVERLKVFPLMHGIRNKLLNINFYEWITVAPPGSGLILPNMAAKTAKAHRLWSLVYTEIAAR